MTITLGATTLCAGQTRSVNGAPVGPENFALSEAFGTVVHECVGAARVLAENSRPDAGTCSFGVTRTFPTVDAAVAYACGSIYGEATSGALKFGSLTVFARAALRNRSVSLVGCSVKVRYEITG